METNYIEGTMFNAKAEQKARQIAWAVVARLVAAGNGSVEMTMDLSHNPDMGTSFANLKFGLPGGYPKETRHIMVTTDGKVTLLNAVRAAKWDGTLDYTMLHLPGDWAAIHAPTYR